MRRGLHVFFTHMYTYMRFLHTFLNIFSHFYIFTHMHVCGARTRRRRQVKVALNTTDACFMQVAADALRTKLQCSFTKL